MGWQGRLRLDYAREQGRSVARFAHEGPLRILQSIYPEGDDVCHNVLVHPPGGLVGGDTLDIAVTAAPGSHGLVTTPGASRFYRSEGEVALQRTAVQVEAGARLEWLPLEAIYYSGCMARNELRLNVAPGAELLGWDIAALGLPQAGQPYVRGSVQQHLELQGAWLERGRIDAEDARLMDGPLGLAGRRCMATLFFAAGSDITRARRDALLDAAREVIDERAPRAGGASSSADTTPAAKETPDGLIAGATAPGPQVVVVRALAPLVEPALRLLKAVRRAWRPLLWDLPPSEPRGWTL